MNCSQVTSLACLQALSFPLLHLLLFDLSCIISVLMTLYVAMAVLTYRILVFTVCCSVKRSQIGMTVNNYYTIIIHRLTSSTVSDFVPSKHTVQVSCCKQCQYKNVSFIIIKPTICLFCFNAWQARPMSQQGATHAGGVKCRCVCESCQCSTAVLRPTIEISQKQHYASVCSIFPLNPIFQVTIPVLSKNPAKKVHKYSQLLYKTKLFQKIIKYF